MSGSKAFKNIAEEYAYRIWDKRDRNAVRDLLHPNIIIHSLLGDYYGQEAMNTIIDTWFVGFPDLVVKKLATINEENRVVIQWKAHGTHWGEFKTIKPTGKSITYEGVLNSSLIYRQILSNIVFYFP